MPKFKEGDIVRKICHRNPSLSQRIVAVNSAGWCCIEELDRYGANSEVYCMYHESYLEPHPDYLEKDFNSKYFRPKFRQRGPYKKYA
jgi:hypothetical protein